jgi:hypothetical protein
MSNMDDYEAVQKLSLSGRPRITLYLSHPKIEQLYVQSTGQVSEFVRSGKEAGKISASILKLLGAEYSEERGLSARISLTPMLQAVLIENVAREGHQLVDLSVEPPTKGQLLVYVGPASLTLMDDPIDQVQTGFQPGACEIVSSERLAQEKILRFKDDRIRTIVLTFQSRGKAMASIASTEFVELGLLASYCQSAEYGIMGRLERTIEEVVFISPLWIWSEGA